MTYPNVCDEFTTLQAILQGRSIARFGDGEIKIIRGGNCVSQKYDPKCAAELQHILFTPNAKCITGIPNITTGTPKASFWDKYHQRESLTKIYNPEKPYYSSFITRPDSAPWINTQAYWYQVVKLWAGKRILLVTGGRSSALRPDTMPEAQCVHTITGPETNAYADIDDLEKTIQASCENNNIDTVMLCLGPTATCLAWRLAIAGIHALDLGHIAIYYRKFLKGEPL